LPYASKLELKGFKSFRDRVELPLSRGLTVIGGPNGSGKSNIVDALCFVLGWMSAKAMRAERFSDFLFRGKGKSAPHAEVSLHFNNEDGGLKVGSETVVISRVVDREGRSTYLLNRKHLSRQEVVDLLGKDLGMGEYNFILQGDVDRFVNMNPLERRGMVEELAGIAEYEAKKERSLAELQRVEVKLSSQTAFLQEVSGTLEKLRVEKENALLYRELRGQLLWLRRERCKRGLSRVREQKGELERRMEKLEEEHRLLMGRLSSLREEERKLGEEIEKGAAPLLDSERMKQRVRDLKDQLESLRGQEEEVGRERKGLEEEMRRLGPTLEERLSRFREGCRRFLELSASFLKRRYGSLEEALGDLRELRKAAEELGELLREVEEGVGRASLDSPPSHPRERMIYARARLAQIERTRREVEGKLSEAEKELGRLSSLERRAREELEGRRRRREELRRRIRRLEEEEGQVGSRLRRAEQEKGSLEAEERALLLKLEEVGGEASEVKPKKVEGVEGERELERKIGELEARMRELEPVNMKAVEQFEEEERRYSSLKETHEKLEREKQVILSFMEEIERKKKEAFLSVFRELSENFGKIFSELSPGGEARLVLESEEDPFKGGVGVVARPAGKEVLRTGSMSGGEKSLTALAFILAVQRLRPASFYVFDEIDAHLDDEKVARVARLLKKYSENSQVIVVTLKDPLMSVADRLFGVTMEGGVSRVLSLDLSRYGG
jgi:chromosome segregation protein